jgi:hypothetical protein
MSFNDQEKLELRNLINVNDIVRRSENPNPITIVVIIIVTILVMYFIFIQVIKKTITGIWIDDADKNHDIIHNKWKDTIIVNSKYHGLVKGHLVVIYMNNKMQMGIWIKNKIKWTDGSTWDCSYGY